MAFFSLHPSIFSQRHVIIVFLAVILSAKSLCGTEPDLSTPQKAWESIEKARAEGDDATVFQCMTPATQKAALAHKILGAVFWMGYTGWSGEETGDPLYTQQKELLKILQEHGIDPVKILSESPDESEVTNILLKHFQGDPVAFYSKVDKPWHELVVAYVRVHSEEHRKQGDPVGELPSDDELLEHFRPKPNPNEFVSAEEDGDWASVVFRQMNAPGDAPQEDERRMDGEQFRRIEGKWYLTSSLEDAQQRFEEIMEIIEVKIEKTQIPYKEPIHLGPNRAIYFELAGAEPGKNKIAIWGEGVHSIQVGEKPFTDFPRKKVVTDRGWSEEVDDSYIRRVGTTLRFIEGETSDARFFVPPYKIMVHFAPVRRPMVEQQPVLEIVEAKPVELLDGDGERAYYLNLLESSAQKDRFEAFVGLMKMRHSKDIGDMKEVCNKVRPLTKDEDKTVAMEAVKILCEFGDEETLLDVLDDLSARMRTIVPYFEHYEPGTGISDEPFSRERTFREWYVPGKTYSETRVGKFIIPWLTNPVSQGGRIAGWDRDNSLAIKEKAFSFLQSGDENRFKIAIGYFLARRDPENATVKQAILDARKHESPEVRAGVVERLRDYVGIEEAAPMIVEMLQDKDDDVTYAALEASYWVRQHIDSSIFIPFLKHPNTNYYGIRRLACFRLEGNTDPETVKALLEATYDEVWDVRAEAAEVLGKNKANEAFDRLADMLRDDPERGVREGAATGLRQLDDPRVIPVLEEALANEKDDWARNTIQESIRWITERRSKK